MKISAQTREAAQAWAAANADLFALLRGVTVRFRGTVGQRGTFTASGVVVRVTGRGADIVTAKHNLFLAAGDDEPDPVGFYTTNVRAQLVDATGRETASAEIAGVHIPDGAVQDAGYDVAVMRVTDAGFTGAVRRLTTPDAPGYRYLPPAAGWVIRPLSQDAARTVLTNGNPYTGVVNQSARDFTFVQLGYGVYQAELYGFGFRVMPAASLAGYAFVDPTHDGYTRVFTFPASETETGARGDSGGPVFAVGPVRPAPGQPAPGQVPGPGGAQPAPPPLTTRQVGLVAVHSGANYFANVADDIPDGPTVNNALTLTALEHVTMPD